MFGIPSCEEVARRATDYLERDLPLRKRILLKLHLMMCRNCERFVESVQRVSELASLLREQMDEAQVSAEVDRILGDPLPGDRSEH